MASRTMKMPLIKFTKQNVSLFKLLESHNGLITADSIPPEHRTGKNAIGTSYWKSVLITDSKGGRATAGQLNRLTALGLVERKVAGKRTRSVSFTPDYKEILKDAGLWKRYKSEVLDGLDLPASSGSAPDGYSRGEDKVAISVTEKSEVAEVGIDEKSLKILLPHAKIAGEDNELDELWSALGGDLATYTLLEYDRDLFRALNTFYESEEIIPGQHPMVSPDPLSEFVGALDRDDPKIGYAHADFNGHPNGETFDFLRELTFERVADKCVVRVTHSTDRWKSPVYHKLSDEFLLYGYDVLRYVSSVVGRSSQEYDAERYWPNFKKNYAGALVFNEVFLIWANLFVTHALRLDPYNFNPDHLHVLESGEKFDGAKMVTPMGFYSYGPGMRTVWFKIDDSPVYTDAIVSAFEHVTAEDPQGNI